MPTIIPQTIAELHLIHAFRGNAVPFNQCIKCSTDEIMFVADRDSEHYSDFVTQDTDESRFGKALTILNKNKQEVVLVQIDNKLISSSSAQPRCDCAIVDNIEFRFVEFKTNALANTDKAYSQTYETAMSQLSATINMFETKTKQVGISLRDKRKLSAHICTSVRFPRVQTSELGYAVKFGLTEHVPLYFDNKIEI